jgi:hypothetical protein
MQRKRRFGRLVGGDFFYDKLWVECKVSNLFVLQDSSADIQPKLFLGVE